jgi:hypothetical protein
VTDTSDLVQGDRLYVGPGTWDRVVWSEVMERNTYPNAKVSIANGYEEPMGT